MKPRFCEGMSRAKSRKDSTRIFRISLEAFMCGNVLSSQLALNLGISPLGNFYLRPRPRPPRQPLPATRPGIALLSFFFCPLSVWKLGPVSSLSQDCSSGSGDLPQRGKGSYVITLGADWSVRNRFLDWVTDGWGQDWGLWLAADPVHTRS